MLTNNVVFEDVEIETLTTRVGELENGTFFRVMEDRDMFMSIGFKASANQGRGAVRAFSFKANKEIEFNIDTKTEPFRAHIFVVSKQDDSSWRNPWRK